MEPTQLNWIAKEELTEGDERGDSVDLDDASEEAVA
jgi:hypothetical protein